MYTTNWCWFSGLLILIRRKHGSAWKQFFFIDCIGIGRSSRNHDNKSSGASNKGINSIGSVDNSNKTSYHRRCKLAALEGAAKASGGSGRVKSSKSSQKSNSTVKSPSNKALLQSDPLFHLYLICVGLIMLSILAIKCLIPGMPIYTHTMIGFAFLLAIIVASTIYTQAKSRKVSRASSVVERKFGFDKVV